MPATDRSTLRTVDSLQRIGAGARERRFRTRDVGGGAATAEPVARVAKELS